jgi:BlaI family penicillinase repressor
LVDKGFLKAINTERPFIYTPVRSFEDVSNTFVGDLVQRVFQGSREQLLVQLLGKRKKLTPAERQFLQKILKEQD